MIQCNCNKWKITECSLISKVKVIPVRKGTCKIQIEKDLKGSFIRISNITSLDMVSKFQMTNIVLGIIESFKICYKYHTAFEKNRIRNSVFIAMSQPCLYIIVNPSEDLMMFLLSQYPGWTLCLPFLSSHTREENVKIVQLVCNLEN